MLQSFKLIFKSQENITLTEDVMTNITYLQYLTCLTDQLRHLHKIINLYFLMTLSLTFLFSYDY
jgi:hypothetical protein